jgi:phosphoribosylformylglycinamidine cyclo-ligase
MPQDTDAIVDVRSWDVPALFRVLQDAGQVPRDDMFRAFNMGVGMIVVCPESAVSEVTSGAQAAGIAAWRLGYTTTGSGRVHLDHG